MNLLLEPNPTQIASRYRKHEVFCSLFFFTYLYRKCLDASCWQLHAPCLHSLHPMPWVLYFLMRQMFAICTREKA